MTAFDLAVADSADRLRDACAPCVPLVAVLLGSGWGVLEPMLEARAVLPYEALPAFPAPGVAGHAGRISAGSLGGADVLLLAGRKHVYEDGDAAAMKGTIRTLAAAGVRILVLTNAAGSLRPTMPPGALMRIDDHLNIAQRSPLHGERDAARFVDLADAYDPALRAAADAAAADTGQALHGGVYAWVLGPQFETPAEIRMLQGLGADAVGMSTVPETILARHAGLRVLGLSLITNMGCGLSSERLGHAHTLAAAEQAAADVQRLMRALLPRLSALA